MKILIAEDNPDAARIIGKLLELHARPVHIEVRVAATLADTLAITHEFRADVTILDLLLKDVTDWRVTADAIRQIHKPVIVLTAMDDPHGEIETYCRLRGAKEFFQKVIAERFAEILVSTVIGCHLRNKAPGPATGNE